jgi:hypothetical protein
MRLLILILISLFIALPLTAEAEKAKTVDELAKMYDVSSCKECHSEIYEQWSRSLHSRSLIGTGRTIGGMKGMITAGLMGTFTKSGVKDVRDVKVAHLNFCFKCHLPQIIDATDEVAQRLAKAIVDGDRATLAKVNINCLICHNKKAIIHKWQDGEPEAGVIYATKDVLHPDNVYKKVKKGPIHAEAVMCGQCHGTGPNLEFPQPSQCGTAYGSYLHSYIPAGGTETCQECHMKKGGGHTFPGFRDPAMEKAALDVSFEAKGYNFLYQVGDAIPLAKVALRITNKAGHRLPDG